ncbi:MULTISPECIES: methyl-accepting chemotaxis protein [Rhizobium]|uniref:Methyl-accepting chemotaxis protein n=1 Tax=Rhizobium rhododendri TaxID=2506430 RepID=A0ABY8IQ27_9HYPH|nr:MULTISPECIES: methyl-accepting chemotaxis protein [Rhizobium]TQX86017.1 methyl-accepting chemotaxis protein [Rhizobium sp. rho-13.1]TQY10981.1 methyl-accepting chemotaxis protein [Rhizobium sp. rho-1.1]WFS25812.1 methyl-accepting chemotaxis protein [Rhizobium rhododendri]
MLAFFNNMRILRKIALTLVALMIVSLGVSAISLQSLSAQKQAAGWSDHTYKVLGVLQNIVEAMVNQETGMRGYVISGDEKFLDPQKAGAAVYLDSLSQIRTLTSDNAVQQRRLDELDAMVKTWTQKVVNPELSLMKNAATYEQARQIEISGAGKASMDGIRAKIKEMAGDEAGLLVTRAATADAAASTAQLAIFGGGAAMLLVAVIGMFILNLGLVRPINGINVTMKMLAGGKTDLVIPGTDRKDEVGEMAAAVEVFRANAVTTLRLEHEADAQRSLTEEERQQKAATDRARSEAMSQATSGLGEGLKHLADGDLTFQLTAPFAADFETLREDFNSAVGQLAETMRAVAEATGAIDNGSREVSASADDLSKRTEQQAASLEETAAALDQITVNVANSSKRADEARSVAVRANESAAQSGKVVADAVDAMQKIEQSSNEISNIIGVIDEIAFQTNLLALNAGVEAARAGEAGKGFAVVAQEVRELAQRSAKAAKEIKELIRSSSAEVQNGVKLVSDTGAALKTIEGYIVTVNQHMNSIATSAKEQSVGLGEVNTAVNQMDQVTQQNAAMVEETSAAGASLANESGRLRELISQFQLGSALRQTAVVMAAGHMHRPVTSPVKRLAGKVAKAFSGNAAVKESWEEF